MTPVARFFSIFSVIFFLFLISGAGSGYCQDFLMGKVLAVDLEKMEFEIVPLSTGKRSPKDADNKSILVRIAEENNLPGEGEDVVFPRCVVVGDSIRLWGNRVQNGDHIFFATDIRGCRGGGCSDPTGVRSRLLQSRKNSQQRRQSDDTTGQGSGAHESTRGDHAGKGHGRREGSGGGGFGGGGGN